MCIVAAAMAQHPDSVKETVKQRYAEAALRVLQGADSTSCCGAPSKDPICADLYSSAEAATLPEAALTASLGCGNPTALAELRLGEVVLDLGCGGGVDALLAAQRVGPTGRVYGLDMTPHMLALARENRRKAGLFHVEFIQAEMERIPLRDGSVDVVISNCVLNLSPDKDRVLREVFRVLKPGGRLAVSDIVVRGEPPAEIRRNMELWIGCVAGALEESEYRRKLLEAGFLEVTLEPTRIYRAEDAREFLAQAGLDADALVADIEGRFLSAWIRARKPLLTAAD